MSLLSVEFWEAKYRRIEISGEDVLNILGLVDVQRSGIRELNPILKHIISDPIRVVVSPDISSALYLLIRARSQPQISLSYEVILLASKYLPPEA